MTMELTSLCACRQESPQCHGAKVSILSGTDLGCVSLASDTLIPTPDGWITLADAEQGQRVFDETGRECSVKWILPPRTERVYRVTFDVNADRKMTRNRRW